MKAVVCENIGQRPYMEDRFAMADLPSTDGEVVVCGVFDGHGGAAVADFCKRAMLEHVSTAWTANAATIETTFAAALKRACNTLDAACLQALGPQGAQHTGSTALIAIVDLKRNMVWCANCGDTLGMVMYTNNRFTPISYEHKVGDAKEAQRMRATGAILTQQPGDTPRLFGGLNVARGIGDFAMKKWVVSDPFVARVTLQDARYVFLATDGIWDVFSYEDVNNTIQVCTDHFKMDAKAILERLLSTARARGSTDNILMMLIPLTSP